MLQVHALSDMVIEKITSTYIRHESTSNTVENTFV